MADTYACAGKDGTPLRGITGTMESASPKLLAREPIVIADVTPQLDCGRFPVKREIGDWLLVAADVFRDGHDVLDAALLFKAPSDDAWREVPMAPQDNDRWTGSFPLDEIGCFAYTVEAWTDRWASWLADAQKKREAGQTLELEMLEGRDLLLRTAALASGKDAATIRLALEVYDRDTQFDDRAAVLFDPVLEEAMRRNADRRKAARHAPLRVRVDRVRARFAAWYELFPRSQGSRPGAHGTLRDTCERIADIAALGFDVLYLPPIHPIGFAHRKGRDNAPQAMPGDVGSPYAIGNVEGGHTAVHPQLGTLEDFDALVRTASDHGMEIALDYALQCSPDHPWIPEHPQWFAFRPDGTIRHAENPPKKYQDIVNFNFESSDAPGLWAALRDVFLFWLDRGVRIFRVDNPHTKPLPFWEWVIEQVQQRDPSVIFLAEAFTRPKVMRQLAKVGFTQSYTYFTWRTTKSELTEYALELAHETNDYLRPNFFTNTPDILHRYLQRGGRPAFRIRLVLAATLSSIYGIYSGFELCEDQALGDSEEYLHSEKYELRVRDWHAPGNILDDVRTINRLRRENAALHEFENVRFFPSGDDAVIFYGKVNFDRTNYVFVAVNLDPFGPRSAALEFPTGEFALDPQSIRSAYGDTELRWTDGRAYTVLDPQRNPAAVFVVRRPQ
ncbi:MAG TPA: alpha-1,4-glucan--maltose-1-phosphate maltosyltransferase [Candidatus Baltobacteraceae bacterium]|nr:alpha-1,4-glucan--maltose-1-phosphate maltosyltransferase [Candidatus Baltobacteraceae bacterium]